MNALLNTWRASLLTRMRKKNKNNYDNRRFRKAMKKLDNNIFKLFCADNDPFRIVLNAPFVYGNYYCATNCHVLLMAEKGACESIETPPCDCRVPNIGAVMNPQNIKAERTITAEQIRAAVNEIGYEDEVVTRPKAERPKMIECPICHGKGRYYPQDVKFNGRYYEVDEVVCPICHGYGKIPDSELYDPDEVEYPSDYIEYEEVKTGNKVIKKNGFISFDGKYFKARHIELVLQVMHAIDADSVQCAIDGDKLYFVLPNIYICVMRTYLSIDEEVITSNL